MASPLFSGLEAGSRRPEPVTKFKRATLERAEKFVSEIYFTDVNLRGRLYPRKLSVPIESLQCYSCQGRIPYSEAIAGEYRPVASGQSFGPTWSTHWFKVTLSIPESFSGEEVHFRWNSGCEAMVWQDGEPVQGLTECGGNERTDFRLTKSAVANSVYSLYIEMACNTLFGAGHEGMINAPDPNRSFSISMCELAVFNRPCFELLMDLEVLIDMAKHLPEDNPRGFQALYTANQIVNMCRPDDCSTYKRCHELAQQFFSQRNGDSQHTVVAVGNCHIDCAWLWPYGETIRKCARSWASTLRLMEDHPDLLFACSQAQQFDWVKQHYPSLYTRLKEKVQAGRFLPVGGTWVEMDGNIPSGEAFVRQFLIGQHFFKSEFGAYCREFWLPDTFGYSAQLPQIMRSAGISYFLTQKISWNLVNHFPHHSFLWEGIDGSRCLVHFPPLDTYGASVTVKDVCDTVKKLNDKGRTEESLLLYGFGDGGGGPTVHMLERLKRLKDIDGLPKVRVATPNNFFSCLEQKSSGQLCTWAGELYLELHNATYTTHAKIKKSNRLGEFLLRDAEFFSSLAHVCGKFEYPTTELLRIWKLFLLNQFHDVLPGTSIEEAMDEAADYFDDVIKSARQICNAALTDLAKIGKASMAAETSKGETSIACANTLPWERCELAVVSEPVPEGITGQEKRVNGTTCVLVEVRVPSCGITSLPFVHQHDRNEKNVQAFYDKDRKVFVLENDLLKVEINCFGQVSSLLHKPTQRNAFLLGVAGNQLLLFDDVPLFWDAWDVMPYHTETRQVLSDCTDIKIVASGPLQASVEFDLRISEKSHLKQTISLDRGCEYLRFDTEVDWHESHRFLKVEFPVDVRSSDVTYEIQFGHLKRPTHKNTSWDAAKFEVCGHKWCDLSEYDFGVAILNDCKYGYSCHDNTMRLSLLRSPKAPDANCDMGRHTFSYAVFPHGGTFQSAGVVQAAYNFNNPLRLFSTASAAVEAMSFFTIDNPAIILESVKKAENGVDGLVLRLFEAFGGRAFGTLTVNLPERPVHAATKCNILEEPSETVEVTDTAHMHLQLKPFEILTLLLKL